MFPRYKNFFFKFVFENKPPTWDFVLTYTSPPSPPSGGGRPPSAGREVHETRRGAEGERGESGQRDDGGSRGGVHRAVVAPVRLTRLVTHPDVLALQPLVRAHVVHVLLETVPKHQHTWANDRMQVNISSHKSNSLSTNCINYYQKQGLQHIIHDAVLDILYPV